MNKILAILAIVLVLAGLFVWSGYNGLVSIDESVNNAWAQVDTVLQRRYDLIPNLVNTVKGYAQHEKSLFEEVARLRSQWSTAQTQDAKVEAATQMEGAIGRLMLVVERYPDLKANQNFMALQDELAGTENRISVERQRYNNTVKEYNMAVRRFPSNILANLFGFQRSVKYFESVTEAKTAPKVQF